MEMAFNPFHRFRKHQKAFMVFLTVMTMIIFVFSFGAGDVVHRGLAWFAGMRGSGKVVTTLYGSKIRESEVSQLKDRREAAHRFMYTCLGVEAPLGVPTFVIPSTLVATVHSIREQFRKGKSEDSPPVPIAILAVVERYLARNDPQDRMTFFMTLQTLTPELRQKEIDDGLHTLRDQFERSASLSPDQLRNMETVAQALAFEGWLAATQRNPELYFGGRVPVRTDDLLDFLIWKHQADRLGIELTEADVMREVNRAAGNQNILKPEESFERNDVVLRFANPTDRQRQARPGATAADLLQALRDEFRVQLAREILLGHGSGVRAFRNEAEPIRLSPAAATPDEFLQYFREQRTTLKVTFQPVKVEAFVPLVTGQPSDEELRYLFKDGEDRVPEPDSPLPGFKEPRRIQLQYASVNPESPFYKKAGRQMAEYLAMYSDPAKSAALRVAAGFNTYSAGTLPGWAGLVITPSAFDPLREEYETYQRAEKLRIQDNMGSPFDVRDRTLPSGRPEFVAAALGQFLAADGGTISQVGGLATLPGADALYRRAAGNASGAAFMAAASPSPLNGLGLATCFFHSPQPREEIQAFLLQHYEEERAREIMNNNLRALATELAKLKDKPTEAQEYVNKAVAKFGLENFHTTARPESRYEFPDDPAYKMLNDAFETMRDDTKGRAFTPQYPPLVDFLFNEAGRFSVYQPDSFPARKDVWVYWKTQDKPAYKRSFVAVRDEVLAAWRLGRARALAEDRANKVLEALRAQHPTNEEEIRRLLLQERFREPKLDEAFDLKGIAHLVAPEDVQIGRLLSSDFRPYKVPPDKIAYPPEDFVDRLLTLKEPGEGLILKDRPVKHFYVAVLDVRNVPDRREFFDLDRQAAVNNPIWVRMMDRRRTDYQLDLLKQMRAEAGEVDGQGNLKIAPDVKLRGDSPSSAEE
jgi:hypothetical protein